MATATHEIEPEALTALKALIGKPVSSFYGMEVHAEPLRGSASCAQGAFWVSGDSPDFVTIETDWKTSKEGQDYHLLKISRAKKPLDLPFNARSGAVGPCSLIELCLPGTNLMSIDVVRLTAELDDTVIYDCALTLRFEDDTAMTLQTEHDSVLGALVIHTGEAQTADPETEKLEIRMTLK